MARAAKKKVRPETPPLYATIENGAIKPAFAFDAERLASYRNHAKVLVWIDYEGSRPGQRKWYAVIQTALKGGNLPWADLSSADISLRLALDMYEPRKTNDGKWHRVPSSLNDYSDKELDEKIELLQALIYRLTGIDPKDFERERAGAGDEDFRTDRPSADNDEGQAASIASPLDAATNLPDETSQAPSGDIPADVEPPVSVGGELNSEGELDAGNGASAPDDSGSAVSTPDAAAPNSQFGPAAGDATPEAPEANVQGGIPVGANASHSGVTSPGGENPAPELSDEDRAWLKLGALWMLAALPADDPEALRVLRVQVAEIRKVMPKDVSADALARMEAMRVHCRKVCDGQEKLDKRFMASEALATPAEIEPKPIKTTRSAS